MPRNSLWLKMPPARPWLLIAAMAVGGCVSVEQSVPSASALVGHGQTVSPLLERGREVYVTACAKCHSPEPVRDYSRQEWTGKILPDMIKVTKLGPEDARAVEAYVLAVLDQPATAGAKP